jgi:hypothetical protein
MKYPMIVLCAAAFASGAVMANDETRAKDSTDVFTNVDADADGKVSKEEAAAHPGFEKNFDALDGNHDGTVTEREYRRNTMPKKSKDSY